VYRTCRCFIFQTFPTNLWVASYFHNYCASSLLYAGSVFLGGFYTKFSSDIRTGQSKSNRLLFSFLRSLNFAAEGIFFFWFSQMFFFFPACLSPPPKIFFSPRPFCVSCSRNFTWKQLPVSYNFGSPRKRSFLFIPMMARLQGETMSSWSYGLLVSPFLLPSYSPPPRMISSLRLNFTGMAGLLLFFDSTFPKDFLLGVPIFERVYTV